MTRISPMVAAGLLASGIGATQAKPLECAFTTECFETEPCYETDYGFTVWFPSETSETVVTISDQTGDFRGQAQELGAEGLVIRFASGFGPSMLTIHEDSARLAAHHASDPMMVNYSGTCREVE